MQKAGKITTISFLLMLISRTCLADPLQSIIVNNKINSVASSQIHLLTLRHPNQTILESILHVLPVSAQVICWVPVEHSCYSFRRNQHRVDVACKATLSEVNGALHESPEMKIVIYGYRAENEKKGLDSLRAAAVRQHLIANSSKPKLDPRRVDIRAKGISNDGKQVVMYLVHKSIDFP